MTDEHLDEFSESPGEAIEDQLPRREDPLDIAWGFVAFIFFAALLAVFIYQNSEPVAVEFLVWSMELSVWIVVMTVVLLTLIFDQIISFFYRRRKRRERAERAIQAAKD